MTYASAYVLRSVSVKILRPAADEFLNTRNYGGDCHLQSDEGKLQGSLVRGKAENGQGILQTSKNVGKFNKSTKSWKSHGLMFHKYFCNRVFVIRVKKKICIGQIIIFYEKSITLLSSMLFSV